MTDEGAKLIAEAIRELARAVRQAAGIGEETSATEVLADRLGQGLREVSDSLDGVRDVLAVIQVADPLTVRLEKDPKDNAP